MSDSLFSHVELAPASVPRAATVAEAASVLLDFGLSAVAVLDEQRRVVGFFTEDDLVATLFPAYLGELRHTAFLRRDLEELVATAEKATRDRVDAHMRAAVTVELGDSVAHVAERFLHCEWGALAVLDGGTFAGMARQLDFCRLVVEHSRDRQ